MAWSLEELDVLVRQLQGLAAPVTALSATMLNNWIGNLHYVKASNGIVTIWTDDSFNAQVPATSVVCATLPAGYRPGTKVQAPLAHFRGSSSLWVAGRALIQTSGNVELHGSDDNLDAGTATGHCFSVSYVAVA